MNIGLFKTVPGRAKIAQTMRSPSRYVRRPAVFQLAFSARGTYSSELEESALEQNCTNLMIPQAQIPHKPVVLEDIFSQFLNARYVLVMLICLQEPSV